MRRRSLRKCNVSAYARGSSSTPRPIGTIPIYVDAGGSCYLDPAILSEVRTRFQGEEDELVIGDVEADDLTREELEERVGDLQLQVEDLTTKLALALRSSDDA